jgi:predicted ArsR family transcriptional regulator
MVEKRKKKPGKPDLGGRPTHEWSQPIADTISTLAERGVRHTEIAARIGIAVNTMRRHYMRELVLANAKVQEAIGSTQLSVALGRPAKFDEAGNQLQSEILPNPTMLIFLGKVRLKQKEHAVNEFVDRTGDEEFSETTGLTESERMAKLAALSDRARTRRARRAPARKNTVDGVSGAAGKSRKKQG